ncbi:MAG: hypothetical protein N2167_06060 [Flavobacteriales bacterium]|nr:hypothetical protein [Flavobacteriales bacterium]
MIRYCLMLFISLFLATKVFFAVNTNDSLKLKSWKENHYVEMSLGMGSKIFTSSVAWHKMFNVAWKKRIKLGGGLRFNMANVTKRMFITAFPGRPDAGTYDSLFFDDHTIYSLNLTFHADVSFTRWLDGGFNLDVAGVSFGETTDASYRSATFLPATSIEQVHPELFNVFAFGNNNRGTTNTQFYLRFWPGENFFIKAGYSLFHITENTVNTLNFSNNRFVTSSHMGFLSLGWTPLRTAWIAKNSKI